jgi:hypothetical protein
LLPLCAPLAAAPLHYQCSTVMRYEPADNCQGGVPPAQDEADLYIDAGQKTWSSGRFGGALESSGSVYTLRQWGLRQGRDASFDSASGAFEYRFRSGCLAQHQSGTCKPAP